MKLSPKLESLSKSPLRTIEKRFTRCLNPNDWPQPRPQRNKQHNSPTKDATE